MGPIRELTDKRILQGCCDTWAKSQTIGTDSENYGCLVGLQDQGQIAIGGMDEPVKFCPWCGAAKDVTPEPL